MYISDSFLFLSGIALSSRKRRQITEKFVHGSLFLFLRELLNELDVFTRIFKSAQQYMVAVLAIV